MKEAGSRSNSGFSTKTRGLFSCWTAFFQKVRGFRGVLGNAKAYGCGNLSLILFSGYARRSFSLGPFLFRFVSDNRNLRGFENPLSDVLGNHRSLESLVVRPEICLLVLVVMRRIFRRS